MKRKGLMILTVFCCVLLAACSSNDPESMGKVTGTEPEATVTEKPLPSEPDITGTEPVTTPTSELTPTEKVPDAVPTSDPGREEEILYIDYETASESLPTKYDLREEGKVTAPRSQGKTQTCWAYATMSSVESNLLVNGYETADVDLSENHLTYYSVIYEDDVPRENSPIDGIYVYGEKEKRYTIPYDTGGSILGACMLMATGMGPVKEELAPMDTTKESNSAKIVADAEQAGTVTKNMGDYLLTNCNFVIEATLQPDEIKQEILKYGAVAWGGNFDFLSHLHATDGELAIYKKNMSGSGHVVSIIGWDDEFSRDRFQPEQPGSDGAWLIKDTSTLAGVDSRYFWLSYESVNGVYSVEMAPRTKYGSVLFYDALGPMYSSTDVYEAGLVSEAGASTAANVFSVSEENELLATGIFTLVPDQKVKIRVYRNPEKDRPDSGELAEEMLLQIKYSGYHAIDFKNPVSLKAGDTFSIVADYIGEKPEQRICPVEMPASINDMEMYPGQPLYSGVRYHVGSNPGESYGLKDGEWYDLSMPETADVFGKSGTIHNASIKALMSK